MTTPCLATGTESPPDVAERSHRLPAEAPGPRPRVLYLAGTGRSGSTALAQVLEQRLAVTHAGEVRYLWSRGVREDHLCQCGVPFSGCRTWQDVLARAYGAGLADTATRLERLRPRVDRTRHVPRLLVQARRGRPAPEVEAYADLVVPLYAALSRAAGGEVVLDSSKDPSYLFALAATGRVDLAVLHLVRDPRAVAFSWTRRKRRPEIHWEERFMNTLPPRRSALRWDLCHSTLESFRALSSPSVRVRYEDFARDPEATVEVVAAATGVPRRTTDSPSAGHSISGNPIRFDADPLRIRLDEAWRTGLPADQRRQVTAITAPLMAAYGYLRR